MSVYFSFNLTNNEVNITEDKKLKGHGRAKNAFNSINGILDKVNSITCVKAKNSLVAGKDLELETIKTFANSILSSFNNKVDQNKKTLFGRLKNWIWSKRIATTQASGKELLKRIDSLLSKIKEVPPSAQEVPPPPPPPPPPSVQRLGVATPLVRLGNGISIPPLKETTTKNNNTAVKSSANSITPIKSPREIRENGGNLFAPTPAPTAMNKKTAALLTGLTGEKHVAASAPSEATMTDVPPPPPPPPPSQTVQQTTPQSILEHFDTIT